MEELEEAAGRPLAVEELSDDIRRFTLRRAPGPRWRTNPPIFVRHVFPVTTTVERPDQITEALDVPDGSVVGVQVRSLDGAVHRSDVARNVESDLASRGLEIDVQRATVIVSVLARRGAVDIGVSTPAENLSAWSGGEHRFKRDDEQINRAEFKLLEAFDVFGLKRDAFRSALDVGAAPGGWSRVLRQLGCDVVAVDPAALDEGLADVRHFAGTIGEFLRTEPCEDLFDLITNDTRMDARMSASTQVSLAACLKPGGTAIMSLKIGRRAPLAEVRDALRTLRKAYTVTGVRQLFHNRNEVTVALAPR